MFLSLQNKLIASQVDRGSMAYVLSTPIKRSTVVITQNFMVSSLILMFTIQTVDRSLLRGRSDTTS